MPSENRLKKIIKSIENLPPFPKSARRILELAELPDAAAKDTLGIIKYDQTISANYLRICNSSYSRLSVKIFAIEQAARMLGSKVLPITSCPILRDCRSLTTLIKDRVLSAR